MEAWTPVETASGTWAVSWPHVRRIITWYHKSELMLANRSVVPISEEMGLLERMVRKPVHTVDVDWAEVREQAEKNTELELESYRRGGLGGWAPDDDFMRWMLRDLGGKVIQSQKNKRKFQTLNDAVHAESMDAIARNVQRWQVGIDGARLVRDLSADIVIIGVGVLTGGSSVAAAAAIRAGSSGVIRGACKLQDTGSFGAGGITLAGEVVANILPVKIDGKLKVIVVAGVKGVAEGGSAIVAGADVVDALKSAGAKAGSEVAKGVFESTVFAKWVATKPVYVEGRLVGGAAAQTAGKTAAKHATRVPRAAGLGMDVVALSRDADERGQRAARRLVDQFTYFAKRAQEMSLLALAVVPPEGYTIGQWGMLVRMSR